MNPQGRPPLLLRNSISARAASLSDGSASLREQRGSQLAHAIRRPSSVAAENGPCVVNVLARGRRQWAIILPQGDQFSFCRQEPQERSLTETQPESVLRGTDCCCRLIGVGNHISAPNTIVYIVSTAATLLTVQPGARTCAYGVCIVSRGVTQSQQPRVQGARL